jgi:hypothetical protein
VCRDCAVARSRGRSAWRRRRPRRKRPRPAWCQFSLEGPDLRCENSPCWYQAHHLGLPVQSRRPTATDYALLDPAAHPLRTPGVAATSRHLHTPSHSRSVATSLRTHPSTWGHLSGVADTEEVRNCRCFPPSGNRSANQSGLGFRPREPDLDRSDLQNLQYVRTSQPPCWPLRAGCSFRAHSAELLQLAGGS